VQSAPCPHEKSIAFCSAAVDWSDRHTQKSAATRAEDERSTAAINNNADSISQDADEQQTIKMLAGSGTSTGSGQ